MLVRLRMGRRLDALAVEGLAEDGRGHLLTAQLLAATPSARIVAVEPSR